MASEAPPRPEEMEVCLTETDSGGCCHSDLLVCARHKLPDHVARKSPAAAVSLVFPDVKVSELVATADSATTIVTMSPTRLATLSENIPLIRYGFTPQRTCLKTRSRQRKKNRKSNKRYTHKVFKTEPELGFH